MLDRGAELEYLLTPGDAERLDFLLDRWLWRTEGNMTKKQRKGLPPFRPLLKVNPPEQLVAMSEFLSSLTGRDADQILYSGIGRGVVADTLNWHSAPNTLLPATTVYTFQTHPNALSDRPVPGPSSSFPSKTDKMRAEMMVGRCLILILADRILNGELERPEEPWSFFGPERVTELPEPEDPGS